jgi:hypothetical protein
LPEVAAYTLAIMASRLIMGAAESLLPIIVPAVIALSVVVSIVVQAMDKKKAKAEQSA